MEGIIDSDGDNFFKDNQLQRTIFYTDHLTASSSSHISVHQSFKNKSDENSIDDRELVREAPDYFYNPEERKIHYHLPLLLADPYAIIPVFVSVIIHLQTIKIYDRRKMKEEVVNYTSSPVSTESFIKESYSTENIEATDEHKITKEILK